MFQIGEITILRVSNKMLRVVAIAAATVLVLSAYGKSEDKVGQQGGAAAGQQAPTPEVRVVTVHPRQVTINTGLSGRLESFRSAGVHAQASGIIKERLFQEGSYVKAEQSLYQLDDVTYVASLESTRAQLATAEVSLVEVNMDLTRYKPLVAAGTISRQDYDVAMTSRRPGEASVKSARAVIKFAQINAGYSCITAPISGYIGQSKASESLLVGANGSAMLVTIQQTNPMYVDLAQSAIGMMRLKQDIADGKMQVVNGMVEASILLENGMGYPCKGRLLFTDPTVGGTTGQIALCVEVPDKNDVLLPGLYVRIRLPQVDIADSLVIPQQAVTRSARGTVLIVNAKGEMEPCEATVAQQQRINWTITVGLNDGDKVVMEKTSIAAMSDARKITPEEWTPPESKSATPAPQSAASSAKPVAQMASKAKPASAAK